ncbi:hypothetical protein DAH66_12755 [Sphingomonas koreensis]|uniref:Uncharacterized protein n=1 Tax=Sphingomonas koreensis TaxID=93064 RepID=A0A430G2E1_9SPHN|nr:hypothetical protein [Sphingomonas koreensis]RSY83133.1 hypothetical protein DAH66_12755 [Sphingomonas koreensis]
MAAEATRAPIAREQKLASGEEPRPTIAEIDRALRSGPRIAPSHTDPWYGAPSPGSRWSAPQLITLRLQLEKAKASKERWAQSAIRRLSDIENVETFEVRRRVNANSPAVYQVHTCPLLATSRDGSKVLIVAPGGDRIWIDADKAIEPHSGMRGVATVLCLPWLIAALLGAGLLS